MTNQIDQTYFWGEIKIQGLALTDSEELAELTAFITKYQHDYFVRMFGETIANNMPAELIALLVNSTLKTSPIANYVYCKYKENRYSESTNIGEKTLQAQNTQSQSALVKVIHAWNEMVNFNGDLHNKLWTDLTLVVATIPGVPEVPEVVDPPTPAVPAILAISGYTITYLTDILPNLISTDSIFELRNIFSI